MRQNITLNVTKCANCGAFFLPETDVCKCVEEPKVSDWEDIQNPELLSKWATGEVTL